MNYYDELGLAPDAADEDIRRAHRTLSKLLHPDRQTDPAAREAAELQMRRINAIIDTLLDPRRRREYDASLRAAQFPVAFPQPDERNAPRRRHSVGPVSTLLLTVTAALVLTVAAAWFLVGDLLHFETAGNHPSAPPKNGAPATPRQPAPPAVRAKGRVAKPPRTAAGAGKPQRAAVSAPVVRPPRPAARAPRERVARVGSTIPPNRMAPVSGEDISAAPPPQPVRTPSAPATTVLTRQEAAPTRTLGATLAGWWLYAPDGPKAERTKLYAPEYIQLQIRVEDGVVHGEYLARYQVPDRPISSEVAFHFKGQADGARSYAWQSDDGSLGVVDLKMLTAESMQVSWRVGHFGTRLGLGAGTAVLIRKIDR